MKKKSFLLILAVILSVMISACGAKEKSSTVKKDNGEKQTESMAPEKDLIAEEPAEPENGTVCATCNMKVHLKEDEMGVFTAQGITDSGERVFFDDIGCILNYEKKHNETLVKKWVRDYDSLKWTEMDQAAFVKTDLKSPMKWGYVFFDSKEKANQFIKENGDLHPSPGNLEELEKEAHERMKKKMKSEGGDGENHMDSHGSH